MIAGALVHVGNEARIYIPLRPVCDHLRLEGDEAISEAQAAELGSPY